MKTIWRIIDLIEWGEQYLKDKNIEQARYNIDQLLCFVLKTNRISLYLEFEKIVDSKSLDIFKQLIKRRIQGEPLQYILGETLFYNCEIKLNNNVLIPRSETEMMMDQIIHDIKDKNYQHILDIGTGSGCLAIALAHHVENLKITALDISIDAVDLAKQNAQKNLLKSDINFQVIDIFNWNHPHQYDLLISNPPYISLNDYQKLDLSVQNFEPRIALTDESDGLQFYKFIFSKLTTWMKPGGLVYLEFGYDQKNDIEHECQKHDYHFEIFNDIHQLPRFVKIML